MADCMFSQTPQSDHSSRHGQEEKTDFYLQNSRQYNAEQKYPAYVRPLESLRLISTLPLHSSTALQVTAIQDCLIVVFTMWLDSVLLTGFFADFAIGRI